MPFVSKAELLDHLIGWRGAAPKIRARLLEVFCSGIRLRSLVSNALALLIVAGSILPETRGALPVLWLTVVVLGGFLPRLYAAHLRRGRRFNQAAERKALIFMILSAVYGLLWGVGPFVFLPGLPGPETGIFLVLMIFGTVMGPYAVMPGILYVRLATTGLATLIAIALYMGPEVALVSWVVAAWLLLRTDIWRGYHRAIREQLELQEALEQRRLKLERANNAKDQANRSLKIIAETDPLTGTGNRRQLINGLQAACSPVALILFDIDHFKGVNDRFGHHVGDALLLEVVRLAQETLRSGDLLARLGGDEFAILLPDMNRQGAWKLAERVRERVAEHSVCIDDCIVRATISLGTAAIANGAASEDTVGLLREADAVLYAAKRQGRNRTGADHSLGEAGQVG